MPTNNLHVEKVSENAGLQANEGEISTRFFLLSVLGFSVGSMIGAFGISLALARKKNPDFSMQAIEGHESPSRLAVRALGWGTALAFASVSGLALAVGYVSGASNVSHWYVIVENYLFIAPFYLLARRFWFKNKIIFGA